MDRDKNSVVTCVRIRNACPLAQRNIVVIAPGKNHLDSIGLEYSGQPFAGIKSERLFGENLTWPSASIVSPVSGGDYHKGRTGFDVRRNQQDYYEEQANSHYQKNRQPVTSETHKVKSLAMRVWRSGFGISARGEYRKSTIRKGHKGHEDRNEKPGS